MRHPDGRSLGYRELAERLADHVADLGFTHVELLPPTEHPYVPSWGYQVTSYFAPTARHGDPDGFRDLVDHLHQRGIGVIVDWVPAHFPRDDWALARFDGTALYEHADPRQGEHPDWGTLVFNFGPQRGAQLPHRQRPLLAGGDARRRPAGRRRGLDALPRLLPRGGRVGAQPPRRPGEPRGDRLPPGDEHGRAPGRARRAHRSPRSRPPGAACPARSTPAAWGSARSGTWAGCTTRWRTSRTEPVHRTWHHDQLTFGLTYAWSENFVLPLSHDEVVHLKGSLLGKMPGDQWQRFANLRALYAWMWSHPGKQLLFMGAELAQEREWSHDREIDWYLLDDPMHRGVRDLLRELNRVEAAQPALWSADTVPAGFALARRRRPRPLGVRLPAHGPHGVGAGGDVRAWSRASPTSPRCPATATASACPAAGRWVDVLNTDDERWGGSGVVQPEVTTDGTPWQGQPDSAVLTLPPLAVRWLVPAEG